MGGGHHCTEGMLTLSMSINYTTFFLRSSHLCMCLHICMFVPMLTTFQLYRTPISGVIFITADFQKEGGVVCTLLLDIFREIVAPLLHMPCDSGIITEIPVAHCFSNCCIRLHVPY